MYVTLSHTQPPPVALRNGLIKSYQLQYRPTDSASPFTSIDLPGNTTSYILTNLRENTPYDIRIAANTSAGKGPFTDVMVAHLTGMHECSLIPRLLGGLEARLGWVYFHSNVVQLSKGFASIDTPHITSAQSTSAWVAVAVIAVVALLVLLVVVFVIIWYHQR